MAYDEREILQKAIERSTQEFMDIFGELAESYPDVARRGVNALMVPKIERSDEARMREAFANAQSPEEFLSMLQSAISNSSEQEVFSRLIPTRLPSSDGGG